MGPNCVITYFYRVDWVVNLTNGNFVVKWVNNRAANKYGRFGQNNYIAAEMALRNVCLSSGTLLPPSYKTTCNICKRLFSILPLLSIFYPINFIYFDQRLDYLFHVCTGYDCTVGRLAPG